MDFIPDQASIDGLFLTGASVAIGWGFGSWLFAFVKGLIVKATTKAAP